MGKQNEYRFNLAFDEDDEDHRKVAKFLNSCGRKKARYIVKAILAFWQMQEHGQCVVMNPNEKEKEKKEHFIDTGVEGSIDEAEISLMMKNFEMFDSEWD